MSVNKSVQKRIRQAAKSNLRNRHYRSKMKTAIKKVTSSTTREEALPVLNEAVSIIDQVARKGIIHKNNAGNQKSRLMNFVNKLQ